ncbi:acyltransferase [Mycolicibacterium sp. 018/SC-01/001]|nr:acyltransferase [Mycolicibacterium sp. 018/SC-01/001]
MPFPWVLRRRLLVGLFGFRIHPSARIGFSFVLADRVELGEGALIKTLTMIKGMSELTVGPRGRIGNLNWITGLPSDPNFFREEPERVSALVVGEDASITNRHLLDCTNRITIGRFATIGGFRSQFITHSIDIGPNRQSSLPIEVGDYCFTGTGVILLKGSVLGSRCVLGAGSMLRGQFREEYKLISGNPARPVRDLDPSSSYFHRSQGRVH